MLYEYDGLDIQSSSAHLWEHSEADFSQGSQLLQTLQSDTEAKSGPLQIISHRSLSPAIQGALETSICK